MRVEEEVKLGFADVLIRPKRSTLSSRSQVSLERTFKFKHSQQNWSGVPIIAANMDTIGTFAMAEALMQSGLITAVHKHYQPKDWEAFLANRQDQDFQHFMVSTGITQEDLARLTEIMELDSRIQFICIDVANGYSEHFVAFIKQVRDAFPEKTMVAGNVVTGEMVEELILSGADIVKVGIGPGSVCTTRVKAGVGYPQLSAMIECADSAHGLGGMVISDGGCTCPGDVAKAFGTGSDFVMLGGMFAGHAESGGTVIDRNGEKRIEFYGMSSKKAMEKYSGGVAEYRASEGKEVLIPYRGEVAGTVKDILGGLRSSCTYVGARKLKEFAKRTTFIKVREQENRIFN